MAPNGLSLWPQAAAKGVFRAGRSALGRAALLVDIVEGQRVGHGLDRAMRAAVHHQLGAVVGALIAEHYGLRAALYASAIGIVVAPIPLLLSGIARVIRQPEHAEG